MINILPRYTRGLVASLRVPRFVTKMPATPPILAIPLVAYGAWTYEPQAMTFLRPYVEPKPAPALPVEVQPQPRPNSAATAQQPASTNGTGTPYRRTAPLVPYSGSYGTTPSTPAAPVSVAPIYSPPRSVPAPHYTPPPPVRQVQPSPYRPHCCAPPSAPRPPQPVRQPLPQFPQFRMCCAFQQRFAPFNRVMPFHFGRR